MKIRTAGDLRSFLVDVLHDIRSGAIEPSQAQAISKVTAQINQSLSIEVNAAVLLKGAGNDAQTTGRLIIGQDSAAPALDADKDGLVWCEQCDERVPLDDARNCKSQYCPLSGTKA